LLKKRGYRWSAGDDGRPRAWNVEVTEDHRQLELQFLRSEILRSDIAEIPVARVTAFDRYSTRD
jgi:DNA polymerase III subunit epsilon